MKKRTIKKTLIALGLSFALSLQFAGSASAASAEQRWTASQAGMTYLINNQTADGDVSGVSDWAIIAATASGMSEDDLTKDGVSVVDYLLVNPLTAASPATDVERRILAIVAAGQDPSDFGGVDYVAMLNSYHNEGQIGDTSLLTDDIFGLLAIAAAGDSVLDAMAQDALAYLLANQESDGGFGWATSAHPWYEGSDSNDTAAALVALMAAAGMELEHANLETAFVDATLYLLGTQQENGGFGYNMVYTDPDGDSTAWGLIALNALGSEFETEAAAARDWILDHQNEDGSFSGFVAAKTTVHSVIALLGTTWLLQPEPLEQPVPQPTTPPAPTTPVAHITPVVKTVSTPVNNEDSQVLSEQTQSEETVQTTAAPVDEPKEEKSETVSTKQKKSNYTWLIFLGLILVAIVWFVLQSKSKQKED